MVTKIAPPKIAWSRIALAAAALAAAPELLHVVSAAPEAAAARPPAFVQAGGDGVKRFAPVCRGDEILDSRPDPRWVSESFNNDRCQAPRLPAVINGATATREQVVAAMEEVKRYAEAADAFQKCVSDFVDTRKQHSAGGRSLSPSERIIENHRILTSRRAKDRAQAQVRATIVAFNRYGSDCPD
ncbi:MAG TPA: hypothetical protein VFI23_07640 [Rhizomicrobium sp.]|nr:hypothetical protein [Rhizomicrobium sp.]